MATRVKSVKLGDRFWCLHRQFNPPMFGTVAVLTNQPGKLVGLQFDAPVPPQLAHIDLDGRGIKGQCAWAHPDHIMTDEEFKAIVPVTTETIDELTELVLRD